MDTTPLRKRLGPIGVWSIELRYGDRALSDKAIPELDELGFGAIWIQYAASTCTTFSACVSGAVPLMSRG